MLGPGGGAEDPGDARSPVHLAPRQGSRSDVI